MVSVLTPNEIGRGEGPAEVTVLRFCARHFTIIVLYFTQVYKWVPANVLRGRAGEPCDVLVSRPGGNRNIPSCFIFGLQPRDKAAMFGVNT